MDTKIITVIIAWCTTIILFAVEVVLQVLDIQSIVIAVIVGIIGSIAFLIAIIMTYLLIRRRKRGKLNKRAITLSEISAHQTEIKERIEARKRYLPELKQVLNEYINRVDYLANNHKELISPELYRNIYLDESLNSIGIKKL